MSLLFLKKEGTKGGKMENRKKWILVITILLVVFIGMILVFNPKKENGNTQLSKEETSEENLEKLEKVNVSDYHLVTYEQSANTNSFIKSLEVKAVKNGKIKFVIGSIDSDSMIHERTSFEIDCKEGENTVDLLEQRHLLKQGEYLFMDIYGQDVLYTKNGKTAKSLVQIQSNQTAGKMPIVQSDFILPFQYTLSKVKEYNALVIGNDITTKDGKNGLAATDEAHDYYALTKTRLENTFPNLNINRINAKAWEQSNQLQMQKDWLAQNIKKDILQNLDLVLFQLGDNFQQEDFETSVTELVQWIRQISPNAEMIWIGLWDMNEKIFNRLPSFCERLGIEFINISDLAVPEYQSLATENTNLNFTEVFYPNNEAMQIISNRIIETLKFEF